MATDWAEVDDLIRDLGALCAARHAVRVSDVAASAAIDLAIGEASTAVSLTIDDPRDRAGISRAREAIGVAEQVIWALDAELARSRRLSERSSALREHARTLIAHSRASRGKRP